MTKLKYAIPVLLVLALPVVLLVFHSLVVLRGVFCAAMFLAATVAGEAFARMLPKAAVLVLSIVSLAGIAVAVATGWVAAGGSSPWHFGSLGLTVIAIVIPVRAITVLKWPEKAITMP